MIKNYKDPRHQPITAREIREQEDAEARRREEEAERPIRQATESLVETHRKLAAIAKAEIAAGRPDPGFEVPESVTSLRMTKTQANNFARSEAEQFVAETPDYFPCPHNVKAINEFLTALGVQIPNREIIKMAWERLRTFGFIKERTESEPVTIQQPEPIEPEPKQNDALTAGFDLVTGTPREYTQAEIWKMSSSDMKKAFKLWVTRDEDRRPLLKRSRYL
jgi:hypothetical protein